MRLKTGADMNQARLKRFGFRQQGLEKKNNDISRF